MRLAATLVLLSLAITALGEPRPGDLPLKTGWAIQSSCKITEKGDVISTLRFRPQGWFAAEVPGGALANLVADKVYPDPYFGMNLRQLPGAGYPVGTIFARQPMPEDSPYRCAWWYRTEFRLPAAQKGRRAWLHFDGINYRANVWLNGKQIANSEQVAGAYRIYEFDITDGLAPGHNVLAVEVFAPTENDLAINWVDWNPAPPDKNMGLWRDAYLSFSGPVAVRNPQVTSKLDLRSREAAHLTVTAELRNAAAKPIRGILRAQIAPEAAARPRGRDPRHTIAVQQSVELAPGETKLVKFAPEQFAELNLKQPRLWWPAPLGPQNLYTAKLEFTLDGRVSDSASLNFGIREVSSELNEQGYRQFRINGERILIRGAGWAPDMLLKASPERLEQEMRYVRQLNLNAIRLEGKLESDHFFDLADRYGVLIMPGWCCCDIWEQWQKWTPEMRTVAVESLRSQALRLRNHPSVFVWLNGSDNPPPPEVEQAYLEVLRKTKWPNPILSSATAKPAASGPTGVKMRGPYEYVPPSYWEVDAKYGGAYGFNTETSPGPAVPPAESIRRMLPPEHLWPIDDWWSYHCGLGKFRTLDIFTEALNARYGPATGLEDYARKAQAMTYDGERAMFEAYGRNKYTATGVIQWMLNNAWPSMIWHLYDWYLMPGGGFFGARKANEPLHVQYSYDDRSVVVVNSFYRAFPGMKVAAFVYNLDMTRKFAAEATVDVAPDSSTRVLTIPPGEDFSATHFVQLKLADAAGKTVSTNFYWLSTKPDVLDWGKTNYYVTPVASHADFTALSQLPRAEVRMKASAAAGGVQVTLHNPGKTLAFFLRLRVTDRAGEDVLPILWNDNFVSLLPGETRELTARYEAKGFTPVVRVEGWNVEEQAVNVVRGGARLEARR